MTDFQAFVTRLFDRYLEASPADATRLGDHRFDDRWPLVGRDGDRARARFAAESLAELARFPGEGVSTADGVDAAILENHLRAATFEVESLRSSERDPMSITGLVGDGLDPLVTRTFAPLEVRVGALVERLRALPDLLAAARAFGDETPAIATATAIAQNQGLVELCGGAGGDLANLVFGIDQNAAELNEARLAAADALRDFGRYLEQDLAPRSHGSFRLGRDRFEKKLRLELDTDQDADRIASGARELLARTQEEMVETAARVFEDLAPSDPLPPRGSRAERLAFVRRALDLVARDVPTDATIVDDASRLLAETTGFVRERDLVRVPDDPCRVIEMPEYRRGFSVAYCDSSGPLEAVRETFYAIAPTPTGWSPERVASFYREYNASMLVDLTVHEAMPGHFLQLMHAADCKSLPRSIFASGSFVEGWAVYSEWLMAKHGFGGPKVALTRQKMVLRLAVNALLDHGVHAGEMTEPEALSLMMNDAFQEEGEAVGKWKRACLSSAQLTTYYFGFTEMMKLRAEAERSAHFFERAYHDKLLAFGSPSLRHVRALLAS